MKFVRPLPLIQRFLLPIIASTLLASISNAQISITVGDIALQPNTSSQSHAFVVNNSGAAREVGGILFAITVADGMDATSAPTITAVDILTGTIFAADNNGLTADPMVTNKRWEMGTLEESGGPSPTIPTGNSTIAMVTFDTTGITTGTYALTLNSGGVVFTGYTETAENGGGELELMVSNGTITVIPEPTTALYLLLGLSGMTGAYRRRRKICGNRR